MITTFSLAVVDGPAPSGWVPWERPFADVEATQLRPLRRYEPGDVFPSHEVDVLLQDPDKLLDRKDDECRYLIGAIVDGSGAEAQVAKTKSLLFDLCHKLAKDEKALWRKLGFYMAIVVSGGILKPEDLAFPEQLRDGAAMILGPRVVMQFVNSEPALWLWLRNFNSELARARLRAGAAA